RGEAHPYGAEWCFGFAHATQDASSEIAMYAAAGTLPAVDKSRLKQARTVARNVAPLPNAWHLPNAPHRTW
ncbi:MAG: hypothetical protein ABI120_21425, partial [Gemmatimonadaceae bacterium]